MATHGRKQAIAEPAPSDRDPRDVETTERLQQWIQELEFKSEDVNPFGGGNPLLTKETESEPIIWDIEDEEEEYPFVNKYLSFQEEPMMLVEEESCPIYDTDNGEEEDGDEDGQTEKLLAMVDQSPNSLMQEAVDQPTKALFNESLLKYSSMGVRDSVASCLGEITRITAPFAPYGDEEIKEVFQLVISLLEDLSDESSRSYPKRVSIFKNIAKIKSCLIILDLEYDDLIVEMFEHFMKSVRDHHLNNIYSPMVNIMALVLEESEEISVGGDEGGSHNKQSKKPDEAVNHPDSNLTSEADTHDLAAEMSGKSKSTQDPAARKSPEPSGSSQLGENKSKKTIDIPVSVKPSIKSVITNVGSLSQSKSSITKRKCSKTLKPARFQVVGLSKVPDLTSNSLKSPKRARFLVLCDISSTNVGSCSMSELWCRLGSSSKFIIESIIERSFVSKMIRFNSQASNLEEASVISSIIDMINSSRRTLGDASLQTRVPTRSSVSSTCSDQSNMQNEVEKLRLELRDAVNMYNQACVELVHVTPPKSDKQRNR
ncbi:armadillo-like helical domain-containing protein [Tanacetum coccineum]